MFTRQPKVAQLPRQPQRRQLCYRYTKQNKPCHAAIEAIYLDTHDDDHILDQDNRYLTKNHSALV